MVKRIYLVEGITETPLDDFATFLKEHDSIVFDIENYEIKLLQTGIDTEIIYIKYCSSTSKVSQDGA